MPGDGIMESLPSSGIIQLGSGVHTTCSPGSHTVQSLRADISGLLMEASTSKDTDTSVAQEQHQLHTTHRNGAGNDTRERFIWVQTLQKRYHHPSLQDSIIGVVVSKYTEHYEIDVNGIFPGLLPVLGFDGATKRNRPLLKEGDVVYCRVCGIDPDIPISLLCTSPSGRGGGFGPLSGGMVYHVGTAYARHLLKTSEGDTEDILQIIGSKIPFEIAIGVNGRVWVSGETPMETAIVGTTLQACEPIFGGFGDVSSEQQRQQRQQQDSSSSHTTTTDGKQDAQQSISRVHRIMAILRNIAQQHGSKSGGRVQVR